jgi:hypothetical protein
MTGEGTQSAPLRTDLSRPLRRISGDFVCEFGHVKPWDARHTSSTEDCTECQIRRLEARRKLGLPEA